MINSIWWLTLTGYNAFFLFGLILIGCSLPIWLAGFFYLRWFVKRDTQPEFKRQLPSAHLLNIIGIVAICIWGVVGGLIWAKHPFYAMNFGIYYRDDAWPIINNCLSVVLWGGLNYYWMGVTRRYAGS